MFCLVLNLLLAASAAGAAATTATDSATAVKAESDPEMAAFKRQYAAYFKIESALAQRLRESDSPRDWALSSQLSIVEALSSQLSIADDDQSQALAIEKRGALLRKAAEASPDDVLVQWLWANASANENGCNESSPCPDYELGPSRREPDNVAAWLPALTTVRSDCDYDEASDVKADRILEHMAAATRYDAHDGIAMTAWMDVFRRFPELIEERKRLLSGFWTIEATRFEESKERARSVELALNTLRGICDREAELAKGRHPDPQRFLNCAVIGRRLLETSTSAAGAEAGIALLRTSGHAVGADFERARIAHWQQYMADRLMRNRAAQRRKLYTAQVKDLRDLAQDGNELRVVRERLAQAGVPLTPPTRWRPRRHGAIVSPLEDIESFYYLGPQPVYLCPTTISVPVVD